MNTIHHFALATLAALTLAGSAHADNNHAVARCAPGFNITLGPGDQATCTRTVTEWVSIGVRKCVNFGLGGRLTREETSDGDDKCTGDGVGSLVSGPAVRCELSHVGQDVRTNVIKGGRDQCEKRERRSVFGAIIVRQE
jgi:hypothetical protein